MEMVVIDRQLKNFWLADAENGWSSVVGNVATVKDIEIGIHASTNEGYPAVFFTELSSGAGIKCIMLDLITVVKASTEQSYLRLVSSMIYETIIPLLEANSAKIDESIAKARNKIVTKFGEHPAITNYVQEEK